MRNNRTVLSAVAFLSALMLIWILVSLAVLEPIDFETISPIEYIYFLFVLVVYIYFWIYFYSQPQGSRTFVDGRTELSVSAFFSGVATGYVFVDFGIIVPWDSSELATGSFTTFVACTVIPVMARLVFLISIRRRKSVARRTSLES